MESNGKEAYEDTDLEAEHLPVTWRFQWSQWFQNPFTKKLMSHKQSMIRNGYTIMFIILFFVFGLWSFLPNFDVADEDENVGRVGVSERSGHGRDLDGLRYSSECGSIPLIIKAFQNRHVKAPVSTPELKRRFGQSYLDRLDPGKVLFLSDQYEALETSVQTMVEELFGGSCQELHRLRGLQALAHEEMNGYAQRYLDQDDLKIDGNQLFQVDHKKRFRPKTIKQRSTLRNGLIQFQLSNYVGDGLSLEEARTRLKARYERAENAAHLRTKAEDIAQVLRLIGSSLDRHTTYFSSDEYEIFEADMGLSLVGIGAKISTRDGRVVVDRLVPGGPAHRDGRLKKRDRIVAVRALPEGQTTRLEGLKIPQVVKLIRGPHGTRVELTIERAGNDKARLRVELTRGRVVLSDAKAKLSWKQTERRGHITRIAVIELPSFYGGFSADADCVTDVRKLLREAREEGVDGVILDMSENSGGLLHSAVDMSGLFLALGSVVATKGRHSTPDLYADADAQVQYAGPLALLVSKDSASAAEVVAGAIKDYDRGLIIGDTQTFGKGTVQRIVRLPESKGALKVTTDLFYRPNGKTTQGVGVVADVVLESIAHRDPTGESLRTYSVQSSTIEPFFGSDVQGVGPNRWAPITKGEIAYVGARSATRKSDYVKALKRTLDAEVTPNIDGLVRLSAIMERTSKLARIGSTDVEYSELRASRRQEAAEILTDLLTYRRDLDRTAKFGASTDTGKP